MMKNRGLIQVYTGDGKGKTTAAVGLACRARGHNLKVSYIHFHKDMERWRYGEYSTLRKIGVRVFGFAREHPHFFKGTPKEKIRRECRKGLELIKDIYRRGGCDILILDEINISLRDGFLKEEEVMDILDSKPQEMELVLTGRSCSLEIIKKAQLVSEIKKVKHPYDEGLQGRKGIEY